MTEKYLQKDIQKHELDQQWKKFSRILFELSVKLCSYKSGHLLKSISTSAQFFWTSTEGTLDVRQKKLPRNLDHIYT